MEKGLAGYCRQAKKWESYKNGAAKGRVAEIVFDSGLGHLA